MIEKTLDASLLFSMINLTSQIRLRGDLIYKFAGITTQQYVILLHLATDPNIPFIEQNRHHKGGMLASELANSMKISRPGITNLVKVLMQKELIAQVEDEKDRRRKLLQLSSKGKQLLQEMEPLRKEANMAFLSQFTSTEKEQFLEFIERCATYAKDQLDNPTALTKMHERLFALSKNDL